MQTKPLFPANRNPLRRWALNDIEMLTSEKNGIMNETFEFLSMPRTQNAFKSFILDSISFQALTFYAIQCPPSY